MNSNATHEAADLCFDAAIRARHAAALAHLSPQLQAQLAQRCNAALRGSFRRPPHAMRNAALAFAALGALALGLQFQFTPSGTPTTGSTPVPTAAVASAGQTGSPGSNAGSATLDQDPDFYVWLGESGADRLALE